MIYTRINAQFGIHLLANGERAPLGSSADLEGHVEACLSGTVRSCGPYPSAHSSSSRIRLGAYLVESLPGSL